MAILFFDNVITKEFEISLAGVGTLANNECISAKLDLNCLSSHTPAKIKLFQIEIVEYKGGGTLQEKAMKLFLTANDYTDPGVGSVFVSGVAKTDMSELKSMHSIDGTYNAIDVNYTAQKVNPDYTIDLIDSALLFAQLIAAEAMTFDTAAQLILRISFIETS